MLEQRTQTSSSGESFTEGVIFARRHGYNSSGDCTAGTSGSGSEWGQLTSQSTLASNLASPFPVTLKACPCTHLRLTAFQRPAMRLMCWQ